MSCIAFSSWMVDFALVKSPETVPRQFLIIEGQGRVLGLAKALAAN
jgi:hypothetical protein